MKQTPNYFKRRADELRAKHICIDCAKNPAEFLCTRCIECQRKARIRKASRNVPKKRMVAIMRRKTGSKHGIISA